MPTPRQNFWGTLPEHGTALFERGHHERTECLVEIGDRLLHGALGHVVDLWKLGALNAVELAAQRDLGGLGPSLAVVIAAY